MKRLAVLIAFAGCTPGPAPDPAPAGTSKALEAAIAAFNEARFDVAETRVRDAVAANARDGTALRLLGRLLALRNRTAEAAAAYAKAAEISLDPRRGYTDGAAIEELAWVLYRMDEYGQAANWFAVLKDNVLETKYRTMSAGKSPYTCRWRDDTASTEIKMLEGVPTVQWRVNGEPGIFLVDTGGGELTLDHAYAKRCGVMGVGTRQDIRGLNVEHAIVASVEAGGLTVANVPAQLSTLRRREGPPVDGLIGASFLMHFGVRIDFRARRLVLWSPGKGAAPRGASARLFIAGERYLVVEANADIGKGEARIMVQLNTGRPRCAFAPSGSFSRGLAPGALKRVTLAGIGTSPAALDASVFPGGLDFAYGFPISGLVGPEFFRDRAVTLDFETMTATVE